MTFPPLPCLLGQTQALIADLAPQAPAPASPKEVAQVRYTAKWGNTRLSNVLSKIKDKLLDLERQSTRQELDVKTSRKDLFWREVAEWFNSKGEPEITTVRFGSTSLSFHFPFYCAFQVLYTLLAHNIHSCFCSLF